MPAEHSSWEGKSLKKLPVAATGARDAEWGEKRLPGPARPGSQHGAGNRASTASRQSHPRFCGPHESQARGSSWDPGGPSGTAVLPLLKTCAGSNFSGTSNEFSQRSSPNIKSTGSGSLLPRVRGAEETPSAQERR